MRDYVRQHTVLGVENQDPMGEKPQLVAMRKKKNFSLRPARSNTNTTPTIAAEVASVQRCRQSISSSAHGQSRLADVRVAQRKGGSMDLGCASGAIYARYRAMASEMLAHGPQSGLCFAAVSNQNMCLDAPACCSSTSRSMVCAIPGTPVWLPTWPLPGGTVRDFQPADNQDKRESGPLSLSIRFFPSSSLTTLSLNPTTLSRRHCFTQTTLSYQPICAYQPGAFSPNASIR